MNILHIFIFLRKSNDELRQYFDYELAPYPLSLFDNAGMRKTTKSTLMIFLYSVKRMLMMSINFSTLLMVVCYCID